LSQQKIFKWFIEPNPSLKLGIILKNDFIFEITIIEFYFVSLELSESLVNNPEVIKCSKQNIQESKKKPEKIISLIVGEVGIILE